VLSAIPNVGNLRRRRRPLEILVDLLLPTDCGSCGAVLGWHAAHGSCLKCWTSPTSVSPVGCHVCGLELPPIERPSDPTAALCGRCSARDGDRPPLLACVLYEDAARSLLLQGKLEPRRELLDDLGLQVAARVAAWRSSAGTFDRVVPVPSHPWVDLRRGFSPAERIARQVARRIDVPLDRRILRRSLASPLAFKRLDRGSRLGSGPHLYARRRPLSGDRVLLIDDVVTTGTTLANGARALYAAGAGEVMAAVWAIKT